MNSNNFEKTRQFVKSNNKEVTNDNISVMIRYNLASKENIEKFINYDIIKNDGHYILGSFGSDYFNNLKNKVIDNYILNIQNKDELNKIISYDVLINNKNTILKKFGEELYNEKLSNYK
jgi:hypothetical protein